MQVRNYMTGAAAVTHPDEPVVAAARLMRMRGIGALPVCEDDGTLAGMLTDRDIVVRCVSSGDDPGAVTVRSIMSRDPVTVEAGADIRRAMEELGTDDMVEAMSKLNMLGNREARRAARRAQKSGKAMSQLKRIQQKQTQ